MTTADSHALAPRPAVPAAPARARLSPDADDRGIAHDLNNLLGIILNHATFVANSLPESSSAREDIEVIRDAARSAANLTYRLQTAGDGAVVTPELHDLNEIIGDLGNLLRHALGERVVLETRFGDELWPIEADPAQLERMLVNLAVNARDAMPGGGWVIVGTANIALDESATTGHVDARPGRYVRLTVSDVGLGMDEEVRRHAFEPFFTTKPDGQGTGLGLAVVDRVVAQAGGWIDLHSERGIGTTITIHLPAADAEPSGSR